MRNEEKDISEGTVDLQNSIYLGPDSSNLKALPIAEVSTDDKSPAKCFSILFSISLDIF